MSDKKPKAKRPSNYNRLSQKQKFIAAAKAGEADESGETFTRALRTLVPSKRSTAKVR